ncbi:MAG: GtrA family protein [Rhizomicrobium sp.]
MTLRRTIAQSRFLRFAVVGAAGFVVDEGVLALMHLVVGLGPLAARAVSIFCAMSFTWWGNRNLTFRDRAASGAPAMLGEWLRFIAANSLGAAVNYGTYFLLVSVLGPPAPGQLYLAFATAAGVAAGLVFNFTLSKRLVFRSDQEAS